MSQKKVNPKVQEYNPGRGASILSRELIPAKYLSLVLIALLFILVSVVYFPVAYKHMEPAASDISQWRGAAKSIIEYNETNSDNALWTQNMFSGMPSYMISFPNRYPFLEGITKLTDKLINWRIFLLFIGGLGIFILLRHLKLDPWIAFFGAVAFIFSCHWVGLLDIGHNTKFRAIMYIPWVFWAVLRLRKAPNLLSLGLLATFLITQLRENHPQISYYLYLLIGMYWLYQLIDALKSKELKRFGIWTILLVLAFGLTALAVMNPYLSTMEYSHYTMRGGSAGLDKAYAQGWSFHPKEIISFIIPDFWGGIDDATGRNYWGYMPFTQVYNYFGLLVLVLGVLALWSSQKSLARFLWITSAIFTLMSFGSATPWLSDLFLKYLPYFNKFRVPSMTLTIVQFNAVILAGLGLLQVKESLGNPGWQKIYQRAFWILGAIFILWIVFAKSAFGALPFSRPDELARYQQAGAMAQFGALKATRLDALVKSGILSLMLSTVGLGLIYLCSIKKIKVPILIILLTVITFIDLWPYTGKHLKVLYPATQNRETHFQMQDYDQFLLSDSSNYRIYPINFSFDQRSGNQLRPAGEWAYYHQTIDGYSAAKLKRYDELMAVIKGNGKRDGEFFRYLKGVFAENSQELPMPVMNMLSTKYIVIPDSIPYGSMLQNLRQVFNNGKFSIYENLFALPRAWFVREVELKNNSAEVLEALWDVGFDPASTALVEQPLDDISAPDSSYVKQTEAEMHSLAYDLATDKNSLLVLSEIYYPAGWKAYLNGIEIPIIPVNYVLRGLQIPAGEHKLELKFAPESYRQSKTLSLAGLGITILALLAGFGLQLYTKRRN
ncbi:MAG: YfhO family protein [Candidatus Cloacimonetes bacterium]|nr:YfhO family protein [Candidatus Cloacimonadota bacterium]